MFTETYARLYEKFNKDKDYKSEIDFVWNWARQPKTVLDLGCGTAHYWKYYPEKVRVFGIERSQAMIDASPFKHRIIQHDITKMEEFPGVKFPLVTALFDVLAYVDDHSWWKHLPIARGGYFIFDIWNKEKVKKDGFKETIRTADGISRVITPIYQDNTKVYLNMTLSSPTLCLTEMHEMNLYEFEDILEFAGNEFDVVDVKRTERWQTWYKLKRK